MNPVSALCPVCDATVTLATDVEVTEVVSCPDCKSRLVIESISPQNIELAVAPQVEEDWGE